jgi:4-amino-4-deoxy-L-arabinose transferase-like glycosyltransferase
VDDHGHGRVRVPVAIPTEHADATGVARKGGPSRVGQSPARRWLGPAAVVVLALVVRLTVVLADEGYAPANDPFQYDNIATSIAAGEGYPRSDLLLQGGPTAFRGPGYPYLLGGVYALSGDSVTAGRLLGAVLGAVAVWLVYLLARRIWGRRVGLVAAALTAVFPPLVLLSRELLSESLFIVLVLAAALCVLSFRASGEARWAALAGALCGAAILTRGVGVALLIPVALGVWTMRPRFAGRSLLAPALVVACTALVIAPWAIRNQIEFGRFVPVTTSGGYTAAGAYNDAARGDADAHGAWRNPQLVPEYSRLFVRDGIDEATVDATLRREAREFAWEHPGYAAEVTGWNLLRLFEVVGGSVRGPAGEVVDDRGIGSETPLVERIGIAIAAALALLGLLAIVRPRWGADSRAGRGGMIPRGPWFLWLIPILIVAATLPFAGLPRYRVPADPFVLILAAVGLTWLWDRVLARRRVTA